MRAWHFWGKGWVEDQEIVVSCSVPRARDQLYLVCRRPSYVLPMAFQARRSGLERLTGVYALQGAGKVRGDLSDRQATPTACPCGNGLVLVRSCTCIAGRVVVGTPLGISHSANVASRNMDFKALSL